MNNGDGLLLKALAGFSQVITSALTLICFVWGVFVILLVMIDGAGMFINWLSQYVTDAMSIVLVALIPLVYFVAATIVQRYLLPALAKHIDISRIQTFDPRTSISVCEYKNTALFDKSCMLFIRAGALFFVGGYVAAIFWGVGLPMMLIAAFLLVKSWLNFKKSEAVVDVKTNYYPHTKEFSQLTIDYKLGDASKEATIAKIDAMQPTSPDYTFAQSYKDFLLNNGKLPVDYVDVGDPDIQYGPSTREDIQRSFDELDAYEASVVRTG